MQSLTQPTLLLKPFAESGDKNSIPVTNTDASNPQLADLTNGFPQVTSEDPDDGGLPPERKDINGLGFLTTSYDWFYQAGGTFTFNQTISTAISGYPLGARLWYTDSNGATTIVRSTIENNTDNFNDGSATGIGTTWVPEIPTLGWNNTWTGNNTFNGSVSFTDSTTKSEIAKLGMPDYAAGVSKTVGTDYIADTNGWVMIKLIRSMYGVLYIDDVDVTGNLISDATLFALGIMYPVAKGHKYKATSVYSVTFYPSIGG